MSELSWLLDLVSGMGSSAVPVSIVILMWWRAERERVETQKECRKELKEALEKYEDSSNRTASSLVNIATTIQFLVSRKS